MTFLLHILRQISGGIGKFCRVFLCAFVGISLSKLALRDDDRRSESSFWLHENFNYSFDSYTWKVVLWKRVWLKRKLDQLAFDTRAEFNEWKVLNSKLSSWGFPWSFRCCLRRSSVMSMLRGWHLTTSKHSALQTKCLSLMELKFSCKMKQIWEKWNQSRLKLWVP